MDVTEWMHGVLVQMRDPAIWMSILWAVVKIAAYYVAGRLVVRFASRALSHTLIERKPGRTASKHVTIDARRMQTIGRLVNNMVSYTVNFIVLLLVLSELGVDLAPLLAGAGVMGLAIGFGAQSLVKDIITGFFVIFEDQFSVGDVIKTGGFQGTVEEIGLRVTRLRSPTGEIHMIPNGSITQVTNFSRTNSIGIIDVSIAYEADLARAEDVVRQAAAAVCAGSEDAVGEPKVLGVHTVGAAGVILRIVYDCKPMTQYEIGRQMIAAIKQALEEAGIAVPNSRLVALQNSM